MIWHDNRCTRNACHDHRVVHGCCDQPVIAATLRRCRCPLELLVQAGHAVAGGSELFGLLEGPGDVVAGVGGFGGQLVDLGEKPGPEGLKASPTEGDNLCAHAYVRISSSYRPESSGRLGLLPLDKAAKKSPYLIGCSGLCVSGYSSEYISMRSGNALTSA